VAAADAVHLADILARLLRRARGAAVGAAAGACAGKRAALARRARCSGARGGGGGRGPPGGHLGTAAEAVHAVLLAVLLRGKVWAGLVLLLVVQVRVGVLLWLFEHVVVQSLVVGELEPVLS